MGLILKLSPTYVLFGFLISERFKINKKFEKVGHWINAKMIFLLPEKLEQKKYIHLKCDDIWWISRILESSESGDEEQGYTDYRVAKQRGTAEIKNLAI